MLHDIANKKSEFRHLAYVGKIEFRIEQLYLVFRLQPFAEQFLKFTGRISSNTTEFQFVAIIDQPHKLTRHLI